MATSDRIYIDEEFVPLADRLVGRQIAGSTSAEGYFRDTRELVAFAAGLGFRKKRFRALGKAGREVKLSALERIPLGGLDFIAALAVAETGGVAVLHPDSAKERGEILEGYANGGLAFLSGSGQSAASAVDLVTWLVKSEFAPLSAKEEVMDLLSQRV